MDEKILKDAQYRKGLSIAYFNSLNAAIEITKDLAKNLSLEDAKKLIANWRDHFLEEHKEYYARVIAKIGTSYNPVEAIKKLSETKDMASLRSTWLSLSEDERRDEEIKKAALNLKNAYEKA